MAVLAASKIDRCVERKCPAGEITLPALGSSPALSLRLPPTTVSSSHHMSYAHGPCCQGVVSSTGSCEGPGARLNTWVQVACRQDGTWDNTTRPPSFIYPDNQLGTCDPAASCCPNELLQYAPTAAATATANWQSFQSLSQAQWLPEIGQLMAVSVAVAGGPLRPLFAAHGLADYLYSSSYVLDSTLSETDSDRSFGRSAAAFARVACRQFGFTNAPVVTTCGALAKAAAAANETSAAALATVISQACTSPADKGSDEMLYGKEKCAAGPFAVHMATDRPGGRNYNDDYRDWLCARPTDGVSNHDSPQTHAAAAEGAT